MRQVTRDAVENDEDDLDTCLDRNIQRGYLEIVGVDEHGSPLFRLTQKGIDFVEAMGQPTIH